MLHLEPGVINIDNPLRTTKSDISVSINRDKALIYGVPLSGIDRTIRASMAGIPVSRFRETDGKEYDIVVRLPVKTFPSIDDLDKIYVSSVTGTMVPLKNLASIELTPSPLSINHFNLDRTVTVTADVSRGFSTNTATQNIIEKLEEYQWQKGYSYYIGGELESREESFGGMFKAIVIAMIAIFGILVLQFRSFSQPLIVFSAIPLAITGSILGLLLSGNTFSFSAFIGLTSLVGIVVNNSIILVDYTNQLRRSGSDLVGAVKEAGETRFVPIILTTLTTIGGLLPLTLSGGSMWAEMGWTIIGGLLVSTVLTLIIVPVLYRSFTPDV
jgi:multidrug efflux pump subunit AcrB